AGRSIVADEVWLPSMVTSTFWPFTVNVWVTPSLFTSWIVEPAATDSDVGLNAMFCIVRVVEPPPELPPVGDVDGVVPPVVAVPLVPPPPHAVAIRASEARATNTSASRFIIHSFNRGRWIYVPAPGGG